jgi:hypothetical protein
MGRADGESDQLPQLVVSYLERATDILTTARDLAKQIPLLKEDIKRLNKIIFQLNCLVDDLKFG